MFYIDTLTNTTYAVRVSFSFGLSLSLPTLPSSEPVLDMLAKLQLSAVGVRLPESSADPPAALWKSPKSPKLSKLASSSEVVDEESDHGSEFGAAAASEKGPNASYKTLSICSPQRRQTTN